MNPHRRRYIVADIEPTIAVFEALRWEREAAAPEPPPKITSFELTKQVRAMRSAYQQELLRRLFRLAMSRWQRPRAA